MHEPGKGCARTGSVRFALRRIYDCSLPLTDFGGISRSRASFCVVLGPLLSRQARALSLRVANCVCGPERVVAAHDLSPSRSGKRGSD